MSKNEDLNNRSEFLREAESGRTSLLTEFVDFLKHNKKWWLIPILGALALLIGLIIFTMVGGGAAAPFIYPLF